MSDDRIRQLEFACSTPEDLKRYAVEKARRGDRGLLEYMQRFARLKLLVKRALRASTIAAQHLRAPWPPSRTTRTTRRIESMPYNTGSIFNRIRVARENARRLANRSWRLLGDHDRQLYNTITGGVETPDHVFDNDAQVIGVTSSQRLTPEAAERVRAALARNDGSPHRIMIVEAGLTPGVPLAPEPPVDAAQDVRDISAVPASEATVLAGKRCGSCSRNLGLVVWTDRRTRRNLAGLRLDENAYCCSGHAPRREPAQHE